VTDERREDSVGVRVGHGLVPEDERVRYVRGMFGAIAPRYDLANTLLSAGLHRVWKRGTVRLVGASLGDRAVDVCCGTGDLALLLAKRVGPGGAVLGVDFSEEMLRIARRRAAAAGLARICRFAEGDAEALALRDATFDVATVGFGIRNVRSPEAALRELRRVLRPGGRLAVLEFSRPSNAAVRALYDWYSFAVVPRVGRIVASHPDAYAYLPTSIRRWPDQRGFAEILRNVGFADIEVRNILTGVAAIHVAVGDGPARGGAVPARARSGG